MRCGATVRYLGGLVMIPLYNGRTDLLSYNYEGRHEVSESPTTGWFPTDAMKAGVFLASQPVAAPGGDLRPHHGHALPNNIIPASRINAGAQNMMKYLIAPQFQQADPLDFTNRTVLGLPITSERLVHALRSQFHKQGQSLLAGPGITGLECADH
jgi:hypothetical protein